MDIGNIALIISDQATANRIIPIFLQTQLEQRFLLFEPLLGPVDLKIAIWEFLKQGQHNNGPIRLRQFIDWVIVGGETGPNARPMHPDWVRSLRDQCQAAGVPFYFKGWGEYIPASLHESCNTPERKKLAIDLEKMHLSSGQTCNAIRVGEKVAGRLLDGREWNEVPV